MSQETLQEWQTKLSPTPWNGDHGEIYDAEGNVVVGMHVRDEKFNVADERLIEAAPRLLDAARLLVALEDNDVHPADTRWKTARKEIRAAINHAESLTDVAIES